MCWAFKNYTYKLLKSKFSWFPFIKSHLTLRLPSLEVGFHLLKIMKTVLSFPWLDLKMLQSKLSRFPAYSLLVWTAGGIKTKASSAQLSLDWGWTWQYKVAAPKYRIHLFVMFRHILIEIRSLCRRDYSLSMFLQF